MVFYMHLTCSETASVLLCLYRMCLCVSGSRCLSHTGRGCPWNAVTLWNSITLMVSSNIILQNIIIMQAQCIYVHMTVLCMYMTVLYICHTVMVAWYSRMQVHCTNAKWNYYCENAKCSLKTSKRAVSSQRAAGDCLVVHNKLSKGLTVITAGINVAVTVCTAQLLLGRDVLLCHTLWATV